MDYTADPLWPTFIAAVKAFRGGDPERAVQIVERCDGLADETGEVASHLWGLAGDAYFKLGRTDDGFRAYRRAIELFPAAGCLAFYAIQVANHRRAEDAAFALECLDADARGNRKALREHTLHYLLHSLKPDMLWFSLVWKPLARWRLKRLTPRTRSET
jgi:tetratricopeptide (TPR) repeat protein